MPHTALSVKYIIPQIPAVLIRPAVIADAYALARALRDGDRAEIAAAGLDPREVLRTSFRRSLMPAKAALVDGAVAALWGLGGDILSDTGEPWLMTGTAIERAPKTFLKIARAEVEAMLQVKCRLENYVHADYAKAVRLLEALGFTVDAPVPFGRRSAPFRRFWIERALTPVLAQIEA